MEEQKMTKDEIIRAIDALGRLFVNFSHEGKTTDHITKKIDELVLKL